MTNLLILLLFIFAGIILSFIFIAFMCQNVFFENWERWLLLTLLAPATGILPTVFLGGTGVFVGFLLLNFFVLLPIRFWLQFDPKGQIFRNKHMPWMPECQNSPPKNIFGKLIVLLNRIPINVIFVFGNSSGRGSSGFKPGGGRGGGGGATGNW